MVAAPVGVAAALALLPAVHAATPYGMDRPFHVAVNPFTFGQAPAFMPDGRDRVPDDDLGEGPQIYLAAIDGSQRQCVTCGQDGPNQVAQPRPQGDVVLYHSWQGNKLNVGSAGFGGLGTDLWVVDVDGSNPVNLTNSGEGEDNYHAAWSPDGTRVSWAYLDWNFITGDGRGRWDIRVADYVATPAPHLANVRVVRPANGHYYETQTWAPDGSGFLYSETVDNAMNLELFFCRLTAAGCDVRRLSYDNTWDEQAVFTPDGETVIFMSTRATPGVWNTWAELSATAGLPTDFDFLLTLPLFVVGFLQPVGAPTTDLYQVDVDTPRPGDSPTRAARGGSSRSSRGTRPTSSCSGPSRSTQTVCVCRSRSTPPARLRMPSPSSRDPPTVSLGETVRPGGPLPILAARTMIGEFAS